ncbi:MAG: fused MFS/spermidine synthase [Bacteroidetes bacterium]|nr:fused MFS/spermidine synthase [Bacteroidota bacterium]
MPIHKSTIILFSFLEGLAVMCVELFGTKIFAPFFGTALHVWASVIGMTLISLCAGYYVGGKLSLSKNCENFLPYIVWGGTVFFMLLPLAGPSIITFSLKAGIYAGTIIAASLVLFPSLFFFAMINPLLIAGARMEPELSGKSTGIIYAASASGAIIAALIFGFILIPDFGINLPIFILTGCFGFVVIAFSFGNKKPITTCLGIILVVSGISAVLANHYSNEKYRQHRIWYESDGLLGQVSVIDHYHDRPNRMLYLNGISQTNEDIESGISNGLYVHRISAASSFKPPGSKALILGMGGGSLAKEFITLGFKTDICEIDRRMANVSASFFGLDTSKMNIFIDDARHYINICPHKYDIIVFDIALGEIQPSHLFTTETFENLKKLTARDQAFIFFHYTDRGYGSQASQSLCKTLQSSGFVVKEFIPKPGLEDDILFIAMTSQPDMSQFIPDRQNKCCTLFGKMELLVALQSVPVKNALVLQDDKPLLDIINSTTTLYYRELALKNLILKRRTGENF